MEQRAGDVLTLYYWAPGDDCWGHIALTLSDGTHISWWPSTSIGANKANKALPGLVSVAMFTEWVAANSNQTLQKDIEYEGKAPAVLSIPRGLDEAKIKAWWTKFSLSEKYNAARQNCSTVVYIALTKGGALNFVDNPGHWWWDPDRTFQFAKVMKQAMIAKKKGQIQFGALSQALQQARVNADTSAKKYGFHPALG